MRSVSLLERHEPQLDLPAAIEIVDAGNPREWRKLTARLDRLPTCREARMERGEVARVVGLSRAQPL